MQQTSKRSLACWALVLVVTLFNIAANAQSASDQTGASERGSAPSHEALLRALLVERAAHDARTKFNASFNAEDVRFLTGKEVESELKRLDIDINKLDAKIQNAIKSKDAVWMLVPRMESLSKKKVPRAMSEFQQWLLAYWSERWGVGSTSFGSDGGGGGGKGCSSCIEVDYCFPCSQKTCKQQCVNSTLCPGAPSCEKTWSRLWPCDGQCEGQKADGKAGKPK